MSFANDVLALHKDIHEVFIIEDREGTHVVVGEASRERGMKVLADGINAATQHGLLMPMIILGSATQFGGGQSKLVGIEYTRTGVVLAPLNEDRVLAVSTKVESLHEVMRIVSANLPRLERARDTPKAFTFGAVTTASEAEDHTRSFLFSRMRGTVRIMIEAISFRSVDHRWEVYGSFRSRRWGLSKRFHVELEANDGSVKEFASSSSSFALVLLGLGCFAAAGLIALLVLFTRLWIWW